MREERVRRLLSEVREGRIHVDEAVAALRDLPFEDIGFACIDHHRSLRRGLSEVLFGEGKRVSDILAIMERMLGRDENILVTRLSREKAEEVLRVHPESDYHDRARCLTLVRNPREDRGRGTVLVISAGTSDIPVAEEAAVTAGFMGNVVEMLHDLGVSGIHRVLSHREKLTRAAVLVVAAGMEEIGRAHV